MLSLPAVCFGLPRGPVMASWALARYARSAGGAKTSWWGACYSSTGELPTSGHSGFVWEDTQTRMNMR